jgi:hypothetical protein
VDADRGGLNAQVERLPTISVGKLCVQPVDKRLSALWHKRVKKIGENFAINVLAIQLAKISPPWP